MVPVWSCSCLLNLKNLGVAVELHSPVQNRKQGLPHSWAAEPPWELLNLSWDQLI